jgi:hypothetical protein
LSFAFAATPAFQNTGQAAGATTFTLNKSSFEIFDLETTPLAKVQSLVRQNQFVAAGEALREHFLSRRVRPGFWPPDVRSPQNPDNIVNHLFSFYGSAKFDAGHPIRWNDESVNDRELIYALNRHQYLEILATAYVRSRDPRYVRAFVEQVGSWIAQNPSPDDPQAWASWRSLEVGARIGVWSDLFFRFLAVPEFSTKDQLLMLRSLHQQTAWLAPQARAGAGGEWTGTLATGLATVAVLFPEFKEAKQWREQAYATLVAELQQQVYPDGSHASFSLYVHNATLTSFWLPFKLAIENRVPLPNVYGETLERMSAYLAYLRRPDGRYPAFNASEPADCQTLLLGAARFFGRGDFVYILSHGDYGTTPTSTSCAFNDSGVFIMRDRWRADANYLALDAGPFGNSWQHEDKLSLELAAFGQTVLVDPGRYSLELGDPIVQYLATTAAHNTLTIDGSGQRRASFPDSWTPSGNPPNTWISRAGFDYFAGKYSQGYADAPNVQHERRILFLKDRQRPYWLVSDRVVGEGSHRLTSRWQFAPGALDRQGKLTVASTFAKSNLAICPPEEAATSWSATILTGSREPLGGWVSFVYGKVEPAPQLIYDVKASLPVTMEYALVPFSGEANPTAVHNPKPQIENLQSRDFTMLDLDFGDLRDVVFIAHDLKSAAREVAGCKTNGCFVVVRTPKGGKPTVLLDAER